MTINQLKEIYEQSFNSELIKEATRSKNNRIAYNKGWDCFTSWCNKTSFIDPMQVSAKDVVRFLITMGYKGTNGKKPLSLNTLRLYRTAINDKWRNVGRLSPASEQIVDDIIKGLSRIMGGDH